MVQGKIESLRPPKHQIKIASKGGGGSASVGNGTWLNTSQKLIVPAYQSANLAFKGNGANQNCWAAVGNGRKSAEYFISRVNTSGQIVMGWKWNGQTRECALKFRQATAIQAARATTARATPIASQEATDYLDTIVAMGIMSGYEGGELRPNSPVNRQEYASMISAANLYFQVPETDRKLQFSDVPPTHWAAKAIALAVRTGFLSGYPGGVFQPTEKIPRQQVLASLAGGLGLSGDAGILSRYPDKNQVAGWAVNAVAAAVSAGIVGTGGGSLLNPQQLATRGDVASMIHQALAYKGLLPKPDESADDDAPVSVAPTTAEPTLIQADNSGDRIEINCLAGTVQVDIHPIAEQPVRTVTLTIGERLTYEPKTDGTDPVTVSRIPEANRLPLFNSDAVQSFLTDWQSNPPPQPEFTTLLRQKFLQLTIDPSVNQRINQSIAKLGSFSTVAGPGGGTDACGWAVNKVLADAGFAPLSNLVTAAEEFLQSGRGLAITANEAQPGDIVLLIIPDEQNPQGLPKAAHMGFCTGRNTARSNSSSNKTFTLNTDFNFNGYIGSGTSKLYRLIS